MANPCGPYPGRQLFVGRLANGSPCMAYLVTGRSPESRQRKAVKIENTIRIGPLGNVPYDPLRHYNAVKSDDASGVLAVSNGIQTETLYEMYRLLYNVKSFPGPDYMKVIMEGAGAEPDSLHTPRIGGVVVPDGDKVTFLVGIKNFESPATVYQVMSSAGKMSGISTYTGNLDNPVPTPASAALPVIEVQGSTPEDLARYLYDISAAFYKGDDIRVCVVGGVLSGDKWQFSIVNKFA